MADRWGSAVKINLGRGKGSKVTWLIVPSQGQSEEMRLQGYTIPTVGLRCAVSSSNFLAENARVPLPDQILYARQRLPVPDASERGSFGTLDPGLSLTWWPHTKLQLCIGKILGKTLMMSDTWNPLGPPKMLLLPHGISKVPICIRYYSIVPMYYRLCR